jgi:hypothetical protein
MEAPSTMNFWPIVVPAGLAHRRHHQGNFAFVRVVRSGNVQGNFQDSKNKSVVIESILGLSIINSPFSALFLAETFSSPRRCHWTQLVHPSLVIAERELLVVQP